MTDEESVRRFLPKADIRRNGRLKMTRFRTKPTEVEAVQWNGSAYGTYVGKEYANGMSGEDAYGVEHTVTCCYITTSRGCLRVRLGDWIVTGADGERRLFRPKAFRAAHEAMQPPGPQPGPVTD